MVSTTRVFASIVACLALLTIGTGCEYMPDQTFAELENSLTLSLSKAARSRAAESIDVGLRLRNQGSSTTGACLGPAHTVQNTTTSGGGSTGTFVDHPGCARAFVIAPGGIFEWQETVEAPPLPAGPVEVALQVQIVNPRRCGNWGSCAEIELTSNVVVIH